MPFRRILDELLTSFDGAIAAMFLDYEGEMVELLSVHELDAYDLKIIGAYQGIFLSQLRVMCTHLEIGTPQRFKVQFVRTTVLSCDLKDGYFLVLLVGTLANEGLAWHHLDHCRQKLLAEM